MALSGSFLTTGYYSSSKGDTIRLRFTWTATQSIAKNTSTISWQLLGDREASGYVNAGGFKVVIDGETVYSQPTSYRIELRKDTLVASGTKTITHNTDGTRSFSASAEGGIYTIAVNCSGSGSWTLDAIPRSATLTSAPNFNDEENPTIYYSNPAGNAVTKLQACISLTGAYHDSGWFNDLGLTDTSYTFKLSDSQRNTLRNATLSGSNSRTVVFILRTWIGDTYYDSRETRTFTVINATPTIEPVVVDMNDTTKALTGDINKLIKGYSTAACSMNATAKKGATITSYTIRNGSQTSNKDIVAFYNVDSGSFTFSVTDNRSNPATQVITKTFINYFKPTCNQEAEITLSGETEANVAITIKGEYFNSSFGAVNNSVDVQFRHKQGNGEFTEWLSVSDLIWETVISGNAYTVSGNISGLPYDEAITIQSRVIDKLATTETASYTAKLTPVFDWGKNDFNINVPVSIQGYPLVDYIIEQGTQAMGTNGTWYWTKWKSGKAECYGTRNFGKVAINSAWGSVYESSDFVQSFPTGLFIQPPDSVQMTLTNAGCGAWLELGEGGATLTTAPVFRLVRPTVYTTTSSLISFYAIGRWK